MHKLQVVQNKVARIISAAPWYVSNGEIAARLALPPLQEYNVYAKAGSLMLSLRMLCVIGLWRPTTSTSAFTHGLYTFYTTFMFISCVLHIGSEMAALHLFTADLKNFTSIVCVMLSGMCCFMKMINLLSRRSHILDILEFRSEFLQYHNPEHPTVQASTKHERQLTKTSLVFWVTTTSAWLLVPLLRRISGGHPELPFLAWFPFDINVPLNWGVAWLFQVVSSLLVVATIAAADCLCVGMMVTLGSELKILRENLVAFADEADEHLKSMAEKIQAVFSPVLFLQFMGSSLIICMVGFQATLPSMDIPGLLKCLMYLGVAILQLLLFCKYGDDIVEESSLVQEAAYGSQWFYCRESIKKSLILVIMRAQRPVALTAAGFYTVSLETFAKLLNASYTYFALLQQLNE